MALDQHKLLAKDPSRLVTSGANRRAVILRRSRCLSPRSIQSIHDACSMTASLVPLIAVGRRAAERHRRLSALFEIPLHPRPRVPRRRCALQLTACGSGSFPTVLRPINMNELGAFPAAPNTPSSAGWRSGYRDSGPSALRNILYSTYASSGRRFRRVGLSQFYKIIRTLNKFDSSLRIGPCQRRSGTLATSLPSDPSQVTRSWGASFNPSQNAIDQ